MTIHTTPAFKERLSNAGETSETQTQHPVYVNATLGTQILSSCPLHTVPLESLGHFQSSLEEERTTTPLVWLGLTLR